MAARKSNKSSAELMPHSSPALTPEERENRLIALAYDAVEQRVMNGTASSAEYVHFLRAGSLKQREELNKLQEENALLRAKTEALESEKERAASLKEVMAALGSYRSESTDDYPDDPYIY